MKIATHIMVLIELTLFSILGAGFFTLISMFSLYMLIGFSEILFEQEIIPGKKIKRGKKDEK